MNDLINKTNDVQYFDVFEKKSISFSVSDVKRSVPRINFKKVKLNKFQNLDQIFERKNITKISLDYSLNKLDLSVKRVVREESYELISINPLRKKIEQEDDKQQKLERKEQSLKFSPQESKEIKEQEIKEIIEKEPEEKLEEKLEEKKDITFNLEAQVLQEENIILSPAIVSLPPFKEDVISASGEQSAFIWPPVAQKKVRKKKQIGKQKPGQKKKPYFISETKQEEIKFKKPEDKIGFQGEKEFDVAVNLPWTTKAFDYQPLEDIIGGGLESELLDITVDKPIDEPKVQEIQKEITFKALAPQILLEVFSETVKNKEVPEDTRLDNVFSQAHKVDYGIEFVRKARNMFEKYENYFTPLRIILLGGLTATLGYLLWTNISPDLKTFLFSHKEAKDRLIVRDLFKKTHVYKKELGLQDLGNKEEVKKKERAKDEEEKGAFKPITEQERLVLIQKARESLESRLDPFGQEAVLPSSVIEDKIKQKSEEDKPPPDISLLRKQVELVGVISTDNKNIALVNIYTADYTVSPSDDKTVRETKLKTALSMAVPDRIEASLLDPIEDWYVKQITKSKSRSEDPTIELVKGDKKFKLKVGQKVLLPEEKTTEEIQEDLEQETKKDSVKK